MNLDLLISKYIDGELTPIEDKHLRELIRNDKSVQDAFNNYIDIHHAILKDAETIRVPNSILRETEDKILMTILNQDISNNSKAIPFDKINNKLFENNYYKVAAAVVFFMFAFLFKINDKYYKYAINDIEQTKLSNLEIDLNNKYLNNLNKNNPNKKINSKNTISKKQKTIESNSEINPNLITDISLNNLQDQSPITTYNSIEEPTINQEPSNPQYISANLNINIDKEMSNQQTKELNQVFEEKLALNNFEKSVYATPNKYDFESFDQNIISHQKVNLTSSMSVDFMRNGISTYENSSIKNYSQSISYTIDEKSQIGMEFGITEFNIPVKKYIKVSSQNQTNNPQIEILEPPLEGVYYKIPLNVKEIQNSYWGAIFYERSLFKYNDIDLTGKLGIGGNNEGLLAVSRLIAKYNLISGIYLSVGAEGRMFNYKIPINQLQGTIYNLSYIWGINFQF